MLKNKFFNQQKLIIFLFIIFTFVIFIKTFAQDSGISGAIISSGNKLDIRVLEQEDLNGVYVVNGDGNIEFPLLSEPVAAKGLTYALLAENIKEKLEKECFYKVTVLVSPFNGQDIIKSTKPANQNSGIVYIYGMINSPGTVELSKDEQLTVSKVIIRKGGFKDFANKRKVKLIRKSPVTGKAQTTILNMVNIIDKGKLEDDIIVRDGDLIVVPEQFFNF